MIREYCDKCHKELPASREVVDPDHPGEKTQTDERFRVVVSSSTVPDGEYWNISEDILCRDCAKNFCIGDPTD